MEKKKNRKLQLKKTTISLADIGSVQGGVGYRSEHTYCVSCLDYTCTWTYKNKC